MSSVDDDHQWCGDGVDEGFVGGGVFGAGPVPVDDVMPGSSDEEASGVGEGGVEEELVVDAVGVNCLGWDDPPAPCQSSVQGVAGGAVGFGEAGQAGVVGDPGDEEPEGRGVLVGELGGAGEAVSAVFAAPASGLFAGGSVFLCFVPADRAVGSVCSHRVYSTGCFYHVVGGIGWKVWVIAVGELFFQHLRVLSCGYRGNQTHFLLLNPIVRGVRQGAKIL